MKKNKAEFLCCPSKTPRVLVATAGCPNDSAAVAALPDQWVPKRSGPILENYLKEREDQHKQAIEDMLKDAVALNKDIDDKVQAMAEILLLHIQQYQHCMQCVVERCNNESPPQSTTAITVDSRTAALQEVCKLNAERVEEIETFHRDGLRLERERADFIRDLFKEYFQRFLQIGHKTAHEMFSDFDERIYDVNQQLLSNSRAYGELEAQLRGQAAEDVVKAKSSLNQLALGITIKKRVSSASLLSNNVKPLKKKRSISASIKMLPTHPLTVSQEGEFDNVVSRLVETYRSAVLKSFTGLHEKLFNLHNELGRQSIITLAEDPEVDATNLKEMIDRVIRRLSTSNLKTDFFEISRSEALTVQRSLLMLGEQLRNTYTVLHDSGHLWDAHMLRSGLAQKMTMVAVEDLITSNDAVELAKDIVFNIAFMQLRCCPDADKLKTYNGNLHSLLDLTAGMYFRDSKAEITRLGEYMNFVSLMSSTAMAEFDTFLEKFPKSRVPEGPNGSCQSIVSPRISIAQHSSLPRAIFQTELQRLSLINWRDGFLESLEHNVSFVPELLKEQALHWIDERSVPLHLRYTLKMVSHSVRAERVNAFREIRLAELNHHEVLLKSHLEAMASLYKQLPAESKAFLNIGAAELYPLTEWLEGIKKLVDDLLSSDSDPETIRLKMASYALRLAKHRLLYQESLDEAINVFTSQLEHRFQNARIANVRFLSTVRLFHEGGKYCSVEALKTSTALVKSADTLEASMATSLTALNDRRVYLLEKADKLIDPLKEIIDKNFNGKPEQVKTSPKKVKKNK